MKEITIDGIDYVLTPKNTVITPVETVDTTAYYEVIADTKDPDVKLTVILDNETDKPYKNSYSISVNGAYLENEDWNTCLYNYIKTGHWVDSYEKGDYPDSLTKEEKSAIVSVYERAKKLGWI